MPFRTTAAALALSVAASFHTLVAQSVILSEIHPEESWVELHNLDHHAVDLSAWSIYLATDTPGRPNNYWWGFPTGSTIQANGYLRIHWLSPLPASPTPNEIHTGVTPPYFLFGLGADPLPADRGAMALLTSRFNSLMNSPSIFAAWVSWGASGFAREHLAEQANVWVEGHATGAITANHSLARNPTINNPLAPEQAWFRDGTPTPLQPNIAGAETQTIGRPCAPLGHRLLGTPQLVSRSSPIIGNSDFQLLVTNTTGLLFETCVTAFAMAESPANSPNLLPAIPGGELCRQWIDPSSILAITWTPASLLETHVPFSLQHTPAALAGTRFYVQSIVFDFFPAAYPPYQGITNAQSITLAN